MLGVNDLRRYLAEEYGITSDRALAAAMKGMPGINIAVFTAGIDERREGIETNLSMSDMKGNTDVRFSRIYDRIFELCYPVPFSGKSWRKADAAKRYGEMKAFLEE